MSILNSQDTICALATAPGGALGIIRISGVSALSIAGSICHGITSATPANTIHYTQIKNGTETIDEALVSIFRAPRSYTGEDCVEISCHGSSYILNRVLELLVQHGCRMAEPGEYTKRAYLNGKFDLSQAEAVADLIASTNCATHHLAMSQLRGSISTSLSHLRDQLLKLTSLFELELDFSDHEDLEFADRTELLALAQQIDNHISRLARSFETGRALKQGIPVAIIGKTNVGKSTLLNALLGDERAIVSNIHGTTRDTIEDTIDIHGITFRFIDTAGLRQTADQIEQIGIQRTYAAINKATIVIWLIDQVPTPTEQQDIEKLCQGKHLIIVRNKIDQADRNQAQIPNGQKAEILSSSIEISAKFGIGIDLLVSAIFQSASIPELTGNDIIVSNARHYDALVRAHEALRRVIEGMEASLPTDLISEDLRQVIDILAEITGGQITPQENLNNIFKNFCVGK